MKFAICNETFGDWPLDCKAMPSESIQYVQECLASGE